MLNRLTGIDSPQTGGSGSQTAPATIGMVTMPESQSGVLSSRGGDRMIADYNLSPASGVDQSPIFDSQDSLGTNEVAPLNAPFGRC